MLSIKWFEIVTSSNCRVVYYIFLCLRYSFKGDVKMSFGKTVVFAKHHINNLEVTILSKAVNSYVQFTKKIKFKNDSTE